MATTLTSPTFNILLGAGMILFGYVTGFGSPPDESGIKNRFLRWSVKPNVRRNMGVVTMISGSIIFTLNVAKVI